ncbi:hypothetical protein TNCV_4571741 [Trichonephila clavipes]|nr:hypothetical protein TNCV_4571741 [Trichonephila clavipes]
MRSKCRSSRADVNFRCPLPAFRVARCLSVHCSLTPHNCETVPLHTSSRCAIEKSSFSKSENPPPLVVGISSYFVVGDILRCH